MKKIIVRKNRNVGATGATGATGGTEEDSKNSTTDEDGIGNEDSLILEEKEIVEEEGKDMEAAATSDECEELRVMAEKDTKLCAPPA